LRHSSQPGYGCAVFRLGTAVLAVLLGLLLTASVASAAQEEAAPPQAPPTPSTTYSPDGVIVQWAAGAGRRDRVEARAEAGVELESDLGSREFQLVRVEPGQTPAGVVAELEADPAVAPSSR
jgi:hypothetical protein